MQGKKLDGPYEAKKAIRHVIKDLEREGLVYFKDSRTDLYEVCKFSVSDYCLPPPPTFPRFKQTTKTVRSFKEARNSFFGLGVYLLKSKFRIEGKLRFP